MGDFDDDREGHFIITGPSAWWSGQLVRSPVCTFDDNIDKSTEKVLHSVK